MNSPSNFFGLSDSQENGTTPINVVVARKAEVERAGGAAPTAPVPDANDATTDDTQSVIEDKVTDHAPDPGFGNFTEPGSKVN
jgi:hypothetical protein